MRWLTLILCALTACGGGVSECESELLVLHQTAAMQIDDETLSHWLGELELATGRRWRVEIDLIDAEVRDVYDAQRLFGAKRGYHLSVHSPIFSGGFYYLGGMGFFLGCTPMPYRVATCTFSSRNLLGSRTACLHELGHLLGAGDSTGVMEPKNSARQYFSRQSVDEIRACKQGGDICR